MRRVRLAHVGLAAVAVTAAAVTYAAVRSLESSSHPTGTAAATRPVPTTTTGVKAADPPAPATPPESRVPRGLTTAIVARLVRRTLASGGAAVGHVTCVAGAPGSGRYGCAYVWRGRCLASLVDLSTGSVNIAHERKRNLTLARCIARNAFAPSR